MNEIVMGAHWQSGEWLPADETPREIVIEEVPGEGRDEVAFRFVDNEKRSSCTTSAFLRTYRPVEP